MRTAPSPFRQMRGQALVELAIAAAVLVPLFLLIPVAAKYAHMRQMAQQATRNAAWEATVLHDHAWSSDSAVRSRVGARMLDRSFAAADERIRTATTGRTSGAFADPMLNMFSGRKFLERGDMRLSAYTQKRAPGFVSDVIGRFPAALPGDFPPNGEGYVTTTLELQVRELQTSDGRAASYLAPMDRLNLRIRTRQALLADAWNAAGPTMGSRSVRSQVRSLVPASALSSLTDVFDVVGALPVPILGKLDDLDIGTIEPDIVPADKLQNYPVRRR